MLHAGVCWISGYSIYLLKVIVNFINILALKNINIKSMQFLHI